MPWAATNGLTIFAPPSSSAMPTTFVFDVAATSLSTGISLKHGWHHVAQKLRTTTLPLSEALFNAAPSIVGSKKTGDWAPTTTSSGFDLPPLQLEMIRMANKHPRLDNRTLIWF